MKILIIDDSASLRNCYREILEEIGHEIFEAGDAYSALRQHDVLENCDLIITDMRMPGGSGIAFLQGYRRTTRTPVPTLVHSSNDTFKAPDVRLLHLPKDIQERFPFAEFHSKSDNGRIEYILEFIQRNSK